MNRARFLKALGLGAATAAVTTPRDLAASVESGPRIQTRVDGDLVLEPGARLYLDGGADTYITEIEANTMQFVAGGGGVVSIKNPVEPFKLTASWE